MTDLPGAGHVPAPAEGIPWAAPDPAVGGRSVGPARYPGTDRPDRRVPVSGTAVTPGSVPLRPLELGDILDGTFATIRRNPRATLGLSALLVTGQELLVLAAQALTGGLPTATFGSGEDTFGLPDLGTAIGFVISAVVGAVLGGMIVVVVSEDVLGRRTTAGQVWRRVRPRTGALLVAAVLVGVLPYLGLALLVVPGVLVWGGWALTTPALVLEGLGPFRAVRRSWRLVRPAFGRVWAVRALSVLLGDIMRLLVAVPFALVATGSAVLTGAGQGAPLPGYALALVALGAIVAGTLVEPFVAGVSALLYVDRRMRAEGLDIVIALAGRGSGPGVDGWWADTARGVAGAAGVPA
ncbi:MAG TPA: hypothetical protein VFX70_11585 [Mycobacteriales bacterium]|nr:hypothetical protein [Mycobacteriales bacterium]